jgi:hypothetical protein
VEEATASPDLAAEAAALSLRRGQKRGQQDGQQEKGGRTAHCTSLKQNGRRAPAVLLLGTSSNL